MRDTLYYHSPPFVQSALLSVYGTYLLWQRYGPGFKRHLIELRESQRWSRERLEQFQFQRLADLLRHAAATVPFYRASFAAAGFSPDLLRDLRDLQRIPLLDKPTIRQNREALCSDDFRRRSGTFWLHTSGTTGSPLDILSTNDTRRHHYAFHSRFREWFGIKTFDVRCTFFGRPVIPVGTTRPPFWRYDAAGRNWLFSSYHLKDEYLPAYVEKLAAIGAPMIIGYPSSLAPIAAYCLDAGVTTIRPRAVLTTAETLLASQRSTIERAFGCMITDHYSTTEMTHLVTQCEHGTYHIHPEHGIVEVLDEDGRPVEPGQPGEVVCTGLLNFAMPLVRYRIGDRLVLSRNNSCACGRAFPIVDAIEGRRDDILYTADGRPLGRLDPVFKGVDGVVETQIVQNDLTSLDVYMVPLDTFKASDETALLRQLQSRVGLETTIRLHRVKSIAREKNGKMRAVVSRVARHVNERG